MCNHCRTISMYRKQNGGFLTEEQTEQALGDIALRMTAGENPEHFQKVLDDILDTEMGERNREVEEAWERSTRNGREEA